MMNKFCGPLDGNFKLVSGSLKELVDGACIRQNLTKEEQKCLQCLTSNYREDKDRNEKRVPGTCEWVLKHPKFLDWHRGDTFNLLWISADPGCGKSVLSRALVDEELLTTDTTCYFFFKDDDISRQSGASAMCAVLHQLFTQKHVLLRHAIHHFRAHGSRLCTMFSTLWDILEKATTDPKAGKVVCILDALDECEERARNDLIRKLTDFHSMRGRKAAKLKFLVTSRPYSSIEGTFRYEINDMSTISIRGEYESDQISKEIDLVIDYRIQRISRARRVPLKPEVQSALLGKLKSIPHRTYLWLHLIFDIIQHSLDSTRPRLESLIDKIPCTVDDAYERVLMRIEGSDLVEQARRLLHIVVAATRPLKLREMEIALTIDEMLERGDRCQSYDDLNMQLYGDRYLQDDLNMQLYDLSMQLYEDRRYLQVEEFGEKIRCLCGLFIHVVDSKIYLIHQTAKEFLIAKWPSRQVVNQIEPSRRLWKHSLHLGESNYILARVCITYLLFQELDLEVIRTYSAYDTSGPNDSSQSSKSHTTSEPILATYRFQGLESQTEKHESSTHDFVNHAVKRWMGYFRQAEIQENDMFLEKALLLYDV